MCLYLESEFSCIVDAKQNQSIAAHDVREVNQSLLNAALPRTGMKALRSSGPRGISISYEIPQFQDAN